MVKCTFLGHQAVFEQDLSEKLDAAIAKIVKKSDETEFLFFEKGAFCNRCLAAVLKAQRRYPQKQIRITLVQKYGSDPKQNPIPMCMVDTVIQAPEFPQPKREKDFTLNYRRTSYQLYVLANSGRCNTLLPDCRAKKINDTGCDKPGDISLP